MTSGGNNFSDFPENQLTNSCAVFKNSIKANWEQAFFSSKQDLSLL